jgi:hypothetical protein
MHSDVGGGYSDDSLAHVSLVWMAREAQRKGLRLHQQAMEGFERLADPLGPMHDSRSGVASYYRYQPRRISAHLDEPRDPLTRITQDPDQEGRGLLTKVHVHTSVLERIKTGTAGYAPIVLPAQYSMDGGLELEHLSELRGQAQELVWDDVWKRRVGYFATLAATLVLVLLPLVPREPALSCTGPQCAIVPLLGALKWLLPDFLGRWLSAFAAHPGVFLTFTAIIIGLLAWTRGVEVRLRDRMRSFFERSMSARPQDVMELEAWARERTRVRSLRASGVYQGALRLLKWHIGPATAATVLSGVVIFITAVVLLLVLGSAHRVHMAAAEAFGQYCRQELVSAEPEFATNGLCWRAAGVTVVENKRYRVHLHINEESRWSDDGVIAATPEGLSSAQVDWWLRYPAVLLRRSMGDPWFQPLVRVEGHQSLWGTATSLPMTRASRDKSEYVGEFTAPASGALLFSVNDAVLLWGADQDYFYRNNTGAATIEVELVQDP